MRKAIQADSTASLLAPETPTQVRALRRGTVVAILILALLFVPLLNLTGVIADYDVNRLGRYLCFAIVALGIDLIWGYAGALALCQAFLFCLGGYCMAMYLSLPEGGGDVRPEYNNIPQFFFFNNVETLPAFWQPFRSPVFALGAGILLPTIAATAFGFFIFRSRVRGVYFAIITQAVAWGAFLAFCRNEMLLGGTNGLTNFYKPLNQDRSWILGLYLGTVGVLTLAMLALRFLTHSRLGRVLVAIRDNEQRLRFAGYSPEWFKVFAFAVAAALAAVGGMLYVPQNGIITPNIMRVEDSIWMVIWVALGGRGRLWGALCGALVVNYTYSTLTSDMPQAWPFIQGGMFLAVVMLFPNGLVGLWDQLEKQVADGAGMLRPAVAVTALFAFLVAVRLNLLPSFLNWPGGLVLDLKYWFMAALLGVLLLRSAPAATPLVAIAAFLLTEALGLMPEALQTPVYGLQWKYTVLLAVLAACAVMHGLAKMPALKAWAAAEGRSPLARLWPDVRRVLYAADSD